jgi:hypothetical protein
VFHIIPAASLLSFTPKKEIFAVSSAFSTPEDTKAYKRSPPLHIPLCKIHAEE